MASEHRNKRIRKAAQLHHSGWTLQAIADELGIKSPTTISNWRNTSAWEQTISDLEAADRKAIAREYRDSLQRHQKRLETLGTAGLTVSAELLQKLASVVKNLKPDSVQENREIFDAISRLSSAFEKLANARTLYVEGAGVESVIRQLDELEI